VLGEDQSGSGVEKQLTADLAIGGWLAYISSEWQRPISFTQAVPA